MKQTLLFLSFFISIAIHAQNEKLSHSFIENFNQPVLENFRYGSTGIKDAFKWQSGVASKTEPGTKVLLFKIDPQDSAGAGRGPEIISKQFTYFGTYSARLKVPDVKKVQPNTGACLLYFTYFMDLSLIHISEPTRQAEISYAVFCLK